MDHIDDYLFDEELVLLGEDGAPFGDHSKSVAFRVAGRIWVNNHIHVLRPLPSITGRFLAYALNAVDWLPLISGTTRDKLTQEDMMRAAIPTPAPEIQCAIADFLDRKTGNIDSLIAAKRRMIELLEERRNAVCGLWIDELFGRFGSERLRHSLHRIEQGWSPQCDSIEAAPGEWGVLKTSAVSSGTFRPERNKRLPNDIAADLRWAVRDDDLLVIRGSGSTAMVGQASVAVTGGRLLMISDLIYRLVYKGGSPHYLAAVLRSTQVRSALESSIRTDAGQTLKLRVEDLKDCRIPATPIYAQHHEWRNLQVRVASIEQVSAQLESQIALLRERRQALIAAAVTDQLDLGTAA